MSFLRHTLSRRASRGLTAAAGIAALTLSAMIPAGYAEQAHAAPDEGPGINVALASNGATVTASGTEVNDGRWAAAKLIDGVINTGAAGKDQSRWSSNVSHTAWATVTFKQPVALHHINIHWARACAVKWDLLVSENGTDFTKIETEEAQQCPPVGGVLKKTVTIPASMKDKKIAAIKLASRKMVDINGHNYGISAWEIEAFTGAEAGAVTTPENLQIIPIPASMKAAKGEPFMLGESTRFVAPTSVHKEVDLVASVMRASTGYALPVKDSGDAQGAISISLGDVAGYDNDEAYELHASKNGVRIVAEGAHGVFNAMQTLRQLLPGFINMNRPVVDEWAIPAVDIVDSPRYSHRGMMIDIARSFMPREDIEKMMDAMAAYKMTVLHLHLVDDQGWRIEITNDGREAGDPIDYTQLTKRGSKIAMLTHGKAPSRELGRTGYLTQADYRALQDYAKARHIDIIPEIDVPGHINAALYSIPELNTPGSSHAGTTAEPTAKENPTGAVGYSYLDPDSPLTTTFFKHVFKQVADMSDSKYFHIGGDEPLHFLTRYGKSKYATVVGQALQIVRDLGKKPIGWNEAADAGDNIEEGDTIQYWLGDISPVQRVVKNSHAKVIMSRVKGSYVTQKYNDKSPMGLLWACNPCDTRTYYDWDPSDVLGPDYADALIGTETALWTETVRGRDQAEYMTYPRIFAHSELGWSPRSTHNTNDFLQRAGAQGVDLNAMGVNYYDDPSVTWGYDLAGFTTAAPTGQAGVIELGYVSAAGTKLRDDGKTLYTDKLDDADGPSTSLIGDGRTVMINWGDGSAPEAATLTAPNPRNLYGAPGLYVISASHTYAEAGDHTVTMTLGDKTATTTVHVGADATRPDSVIDEWAPAVPPSVTIESKGEPSDRLRFDVENFKPDTLADVYLGEENLGRVRPDADGSRHMHLFIPPSTKAGVYPVRVTNGSDEATTTVAIWAPQAPQAPWPPGGIKGVTATADSEEKAGEPAPSGLASAAVDGNPHTYWHTQWQNNVAPMPHHLDLDLHKTCSVTELHYMPRQNSENTRIKNYEVYTSTDGTNWGNAVATGSFEAGAHTQVVTLPGTPVTHVRLKALSSQAGSAFAGAAEVWLVGKCVSETGTATVTAGERDDVTLTKTPVTVEAYADDTITVRVSSGAAKQVTLWAGADHQIVAHANVNGGATTLTFAASDYTNGTMFEAIAGAERYYFTLAIVDKPEPGKPTVEPTTEPTMEPTTEPTAEPEPTVEPTKEPTAEPEPTVEPTKEPVGERELVRAIGPKPLGDPFKDVGRDSQFAGEIEWMRGSGTSTGWSDGTYRPLLSIQRDAMAAFLYRMAGEPVVMTGDALFTDVTRSTRFGDAIYWMHEQGIATGYKDGTFRPLGVVNRDAMAAFMYRFCSHLPSRCAQAVNPATLDTSSVPLFTDVGIDNQFATEIRWMAGAKISTGYKDGTFRPVTPVKRDAMAAFIYRMRNNYMK